MLWAFKAASSVGSVLRRCDVQTPWLRKPLKAIPKWTASPVSQSTMTDEKKKLGLNIRIMEIKRGYK
jgi:hypothetical protein